LNDIPDSAPADAPDDTEAETPAAGSTPVPPAPPAPPKKSIADRMIRGSAAVVLARMFLALFGLIQMKVLGHFFGTTALTAGFLFALEGIIFQFLFAGEKVVVPPLVPVFNEAKNEGREQEAWLGASVLFNILAVLLTASVVALCLWPSAPVEFFAWLNGKVPDPATADFQKLREYDDLVRYSAVFLRWGAPTVIGLVLGSVTYAILNSYKRFFWAAFGEGSTKIIIVASIVAGGVALRGSESQAVMAMAMVLMTAGFARLFTHLVALRDKLRYFRPLVVWRSPAFRKWLLLAAPLMLGVVLARSRDIYNHYGAFAGLGKGIMTANSMGRKISNVPVSLVPFAVAIAMFPFFCDMVDRDDKGELGRFLTKACRMLLVVYAPMAAGIAALSLPATRLLFQGGKVTLEAMQLASMACLCYAIALPALAIEAVVMQAFFSDRRMIAPTVIGFTMTGASIFWSWLAISKLGLTDGRAAIAAVALGYVVSRLIKVVLLIASLRRTIPAFPLAATASYLARLAAVTAATGGTAWLVRRAYESRVDVYSSSAKGMLQVAKLVGPQVLLASSAGIVVFLLGCWVLRLSELGEMAGWAREKLRRRGKPPADAGSAD